MVLCRQLIGVILCAAARPTAASAVAAEVQTRRLQEDESLTPTSSPTLPAPTSYSYGYEPTVEPTDSQPTAAPAAAAPEDYAPTAAPAVAPPTATPTTPEPSAAAPEDYVPTVAPAVAPPVYAPTPTPTTAEPSAPTAAPAVITLEPTDLYAPSPAPAAATLEPTLDPDCVKSSVKIKGPVARAQLIPGGASCLGPILFLSLIFAQVNSPLWFKNGDPSKNCDCASPARSTDPRSTDPRARGR